MMFFNRNTKYLYQ